MIPSLKLASGKIERAMIEEDFVVPLMKILLGLRENCFCVLEVDLVPQILV
jgi:hypothetical protein